MRKPPSSKSLVVGLLPAFALLAACGVGEESAPSPGASVTQAIAAANAEADARLGLLARVSLDDSQELAEFYEPVPGRILFSMAGQPPSGPSLTQKDVAGLSIPEIWQKVARDAPMPQALANALSHSPEASPDLVSQPGSGGAANGASTNPTHGHVSHLTNGYCGTRWLTDFPCPGGGHSDQWCVYDQGGSDNAWVNNGTGYYFNVCSELGSVQLNLSGNTVNGAWTVLENTYRWYSWVDGSTHCWSCFSVLGNCIGGSGGCAGYLSETGSVSPNGGAVYNWEGTLDWP